LVRKESALIFLPVVEKEMANIQREVVGYMAEAMAKLNNDAALDFGLFAIEQMASRQVVLEVEVIPDHILMSKDAKIKKEVAEIHAAKKNYEQAARILERINYEGMNAKVSVDEKAEVYVQIAEHWFEEDDSVNAEKYINKAAHIIYDVQDPQIVIRYRICHAKISDSKRKFILAAHSYYALSNQESVVPEELLQLLEMALTCALLAPAGPQKSRILSVIHKDERSRKLAHYEILEKMFYGRVIKKPEVKAFEETLQVHQNIVSKDGYTVLEKALLEHNIEVISKIYKNISFEELGRFLEIATDKAEKIIAQMAMEKRIQAQLDQRERMVEFESDSKQVTMFNSQISHVCNEVNQLIAEVLKVHPELQKYDTHRFE